MINFRTKLLAAWR